MIKFHARSDSNRQTYWEEIEGIIAEKPHLKNVYHREIGNSNAKQIARRLSEIGLSPGWFGALKMLLLLQEKARKK